MDDPTTKAEFAPGNLLFFERGTVHALPDILEEPVMFRSVDTPRREPTDIIFVNPEDGTPATFMARNVRVRRIVTPCRAFSAMRGPAGARSRAPFRRRRCGS